MAWYELAGLVRPLLKLALAAALTGIALHYAARWLATAIELQTVFRQLLAGTVLATGGIALYLALNLLLRNRQMLALLSIVRNHLRLRKAA